MSRLWLKQLGLRSPALRSSVALRQSARPLHFDNTLQDVWASLNFSFREFLGIAIDRAAVSNKQVQDTIFECLSEVVSAEVSAEVEPEHILYILLFFLAHSSP